MNSSLRVQPCHLLLGRDAGYVGTWRSAIRASQNKAQLPSILVCLVEIVILTKYKLIRKSVPLQFMPISLLYCGPNCILGFLVTH